VDGSDSGSCPLAGSGFDRVELACLFAHIMEYVIILNRPIESRQADKPHFLALSLRILKD
jgi:hypothetical protein